MSATVPDLHNIMGVSNTYLATDILPTKVGDLIVSDGGGEDGLFTDGIERVWRLVKATTAIGVGDPVARTLGDKTWGCREAPVDHLSGNILGVAVTAIAAGSYGWIVKEGPALVNFAGTVNQGGGIQMSGSTAGTAITSTTKTDSVFGEQLGTAVDANNRLECFVKC